MLELAYLGRWVTVARKGDDSSAARRYDEIFQKILALATTLGCADLIEENDDGTLSPSVELEDNERVREIMAEFDNDTFWNELVTRLAEREYAAEQARRALTDTPGVEPPPTPEERLKQIEETYWDEFEKHDLTNMVVLRGGRG